jgi:hypothetical protein
MQKEQKMNVISKIRHGSHLYGLSTENSDVDYKGIFLPTLDEMVTMTASHEIRHSTGPKDSKNSAGDVDTVYFSLQKFIKMACDGETIALDYLHCNDENLLETGPVWQALVANRSRFYTKNMKAFLGYCRKQASKYGVKGTRLKAMEEVLEALKAELSKDPEARMDVAEPSLRKVEAANPDNVAVKDGFYKGSKRVEKKIVEVCDAKYDFTCSVQYVVTALQKKYDAYGHRAIQAKNNEGVDFKAVSHALRAGYQLKEIYETGDLKYPLHYRVFLLAVKQGKLDFTTQVQPVLENLVDEIEVLAEQSDLPEKVDRKYWDQFIVDVYNGVYG